MIDTPHVRVGIGVYIFNKNNQILLGLRKSKHGYNSWCPPGGHLEFGETPQECAKRETLEEANINIENIHFISLTNDVFLDDNKHYITLHYKAQWASGDVKINEEDKIIDWQWFNWDNLPQPLFQSFQNFYNQVTLQEILERP